LKQRPVLRLKAKVAALELRQELLPGNRLKLSNRAVMFFSVCGVG
jgi:hypothetical protein